MWAQKILADAIDDAKGNLRDDMHDFLSEYMVHKHGLASIAQKHGAALTRAVLRFSQDGALTPEALAAARITSQQA
eukprot:COSAG01_NODE_15951_length_1283_cov_2.086149_3_plen_75_part_01